MVEAFVIGWNEEETIRLTLSHYSSFCEKVTLFDNYSTDGTPDIARSMGAEVKQFGTPGVLSDDDYLTVKNNCWKKSKADWVVVCDADEILMSNRIYSIRFVLESAREEGATIFTPLGYDIYSNNMPEDLRDIQHGFINHNYSKNVIFNPKQIREINFRYGCHVSKPVGNVAFAEWKLFLLHYRNIGGPKRLVDRHALYRTRMSEKNIRFGLGVHYMTPDMHPQGITDEQRIKEWYDKYDGCSELSLAGLGY